MSESGDPPPLPPFAQPIAVQPLSVPAPAYPQQYPYDPNEYGHVRRPPGIITAIAIISITVGSLGMIGGGLSGLYGAIFYFVARTSAVMSANAAAAAAAVPPAPVVDETSVDPNAPPLVEDRGLETAKRQIIVDVLAESRPLNDSRRRQLHALLAKAGQDIFENSSADFTSADIRRAITQSGQLPSASDADPNAGPDFFVIATGRIEVSDDRALFEPSDHSIETIRVAVPLPSTNPDANGTASPQNGISNQDVRVAVRFINQQVGHRLTSQQRTALSTEFSSNGGLLIPPSAGAPIASQLVSSTLQPDSSVLVLTPQGQIQVGPTGIVQSRMVYATTTTGGVTTFNYHSSATAVNPFIGSNGKPAIPAASAILVVFEAILSILLSIYLLIIGILMLRQNPRSRRLHVIYAILKIPLAIVCGIAWCWIVGGLMSSTPNSGGTAAIQTTRAFVVAFVAGVAIIYPIALLIAFRTPTVKQYYDSGAR